MKRKADKSLTKARVWFWLSVGFFTLNSCTFLLMPFIKKSLFDQSLAWKAASLGSIFWASLIMAVLSVILSSVFRRKYLKNNGIDRKQIKGRIGLITFFSTVLGKIADFLLAASIAALAVVCLTRQTNNDITFVIIALLVFSLSMHCMFNGLIFKTITLKQMGREQK